VLYVPATHAVHAAAPVVSALNMPATHEVHPDEPVKHGADAPIPQAVQTAAAEAPVTLA
jgi:hypothetical protein